MKRALMLIFGYFIALLPLTTFSMSNDELEQFSIRIEESRKAAVLEARESIHELESDEGRRLPISVRQQEYLQDGMKLMQANEWSEAELPFSQVLKLNTAPTKGSEQIFLFAAGNLTKIYLFQFKLPEAKQMIDEMEGVYANLPNKDELHTFSFSMLKAEYHLANGDSKTFNLEINGIHDDLINSKYLNENYVPYKNILLAYTQLLMKAGLWKESYLALKEEEQKYLQAAGAAANLNDLWAMKVGYITILNRLGEYQDIDQIIDESEKVENLYVGIKAVILSAKGDRAYRKKEFLEAIKYFDSAAELMKNIRTPTNITVGNYLSITNIYLNQLNIELAKQYLNKAIQSTESNPGANRTALEHNFTRIAQYALKLGDTKLATDYLTKSLILAKYNTIQKSDLNQQLLLFDIATINRDVKNQILAESKISEGLINPVYQRQLSGIGHHNDNSTLDGYYELYKKDPKKYFLRSFQFAQILGVTSIEKAFIQSIQLAVIKNDNVQALLRQKQFIEQAEEKISVTNDNGTNELLRLKSELSRINNQLEKIMPGYAFGTDDTPVATAPLHTALNPDQAIIQFLPGKDAYYAWVINKNHERMIRLDASPGQLRSMVSLLRKSLTVNSQAQLLPYATSTAHDLYTILFKPLMPALGKSKHIFLVPDETLLALPFPALVIKQSRASGPTWLANRFSFSVLPSPKSLLYWKNSKSVGQASSPFIGFGDPSLSSTNRTSNAEPISSRGIFLNPVADHKILESLPDLPESGKELISISHSLGANEDSVFLKDRATESNVKKLPLKDYRIITFATHSLLPEDIDGIGETGLVLSPPINSDNFDDGVLTAREVLGLKLNADWVILSACNTALGNDVTADGLTGLARSFFFSGARSLLVSAWPVESSSAAFLTTQTISNMVKDKGISKAEALRRSMISLASDQSQNKKHPFFWAPFYLVGSIKSEFSSFH